MRAPIAAAALVGALALAGHATAAPAGDTCSATGSGMNYTLTVILGQNSPEQYGFAIGAQGTTVTAASSGNATTTTTTTTTAAPTLPSGTTASWRLGQAVVPGDTVTISVATGATVTSGFTVVPYDQIHNTWFDAVGCQLSKVAPPSNAFTLGSFVHKGSVWAARVKVASAGRLTVAQDGGTKLLVATTRTSVHGNATATVRLTAAGRRAIAARAVKLKISVEFEPTNGKPRTRVVTLTLHS